MKLEKSEITLAKGKEAKVSKTGISKIKDEKTMAVRTEIDLRGLNC